MAKEDAFEPKDLCERTHYFDPELEGSVEYPSGVKSFRG